MRTSKITCIIHKDLSMKISDALKESGIVCYTVQFGRSVVLREKKRLLGLTSETVLEDDPVDVYRIYVRPETAEGLLGLLAEKGDLSTPGRGTVFSEEISVVKKTDCLMNSIRLKAPREKAQFAEDLTGICCIVQRGQAVPIIRSLLETGTVPVVTYGEGTGVRDKLGLLRIAIPAEKEIVNAVVSRYDAEQMMNMLIDIGRLDQPGKGFIYIFPVNKGLINAKTQRGRRRHGASMEQIVSAIDNLKGNPEWRKMETVTKSSGKRKYLRDLASFNLITNDGKAMEIVKAAMASGAPGATISRGRQVVPEKTGVSSAREMSDLIVGKPQIAALSKIVEAAGLFTKEASGLIETGPVPLACTYLGGK